MKYGIPSLLCGCEIWMLKQRDEQMTLAEFMTYTTGYCLLDHGRNGDILEEINMGPIKKKLP
jgi:hypothetical protein